MSQVDLFSQTAGVGGALNYKAGPLVVGLQLDNIIGGDRTDTALTYAGSRAFDVAEGARQTYDDGRAVRISAAGRCRAAGRSRRLGSGAPPPPPPPPPPFCG